MCGAPQLPTASVPSGGRGDRESGDHQGFSRRPPLRAHVEADDRLAHTPPARGAKAAPGVPLSWRPSGLWGRGTGSSSVGRAAFPCHLRRWQARPGRRPRTPVSAASLPARPACPLQLSALVWRGRRGGPDCREPPPTVVTARQCFIRGTLTGFLPAGRLLPSSTKCVLAQPAPRV